MCTAFVCLVAMFAATGSEMWPQDAAPAAPVAVSKSEIEIRRTVEAFRAAFDKGDAEALAATFTEEGELAPEDGPVIRGRKGIAAHFAEIFKAMPGAKLVIEPASIRTLAPEAAIEEGRSAIRSSEGEVGASRYEAYYVKKDGTWLQARVREFADEAVSPHERLKPLEWLIGEWVDEGDGGKVDSTCSWSEDKNYLLRTFDVQLAGQPRLTLHQRIGWDPISKQLKGWTFDSRGMYSEESWARDEAGAWVIKASGVLPDGRRATATNRLQPTGPHAATWVSVDRTVGDEVLPDTERYVLVRRPPSPK